MIGILFTLLFIGQQPGQVSAQPTTDALPKVFLIGQFQDEYEALNVECDRTLLNNCGESMELAYAKWMGLLNDIEKYSEHVGYDIKGVKLYINVYWNSDGSIKHLVYYLKTNSKNMNLDELTTFFDSFTEQYKPRIVDQVCFSHNGSANFPIYAKLFVPKG